MKCRRCVFSCRLSRTSVVSGSGGTNLPRGEGSHARNQLASWPVQRKGGASDGYGGQAYGRQQKQGRTVGTCHTCVHSSTDSPFHWVERPSVRLNHQLVHQTVDALETQRFPNRRYTRSPRGKNVTNPCKFTFMRAKSYPASQTVKSWMTRIREQDSAKFLKAKAKRRIRIRDFGIFGLKFENSGAGWCVLCQLFSVEILIETAALVIGSSAERFERGTARPGAIGGSRAWERVSREQASSTVEQGKLLLSSALSLFVRHLAAGFSPR